LNFPMILFCLKLLSSLTQPDLKEFPETEAIRKNLLEIFKAADTPKNIIGLIPKLFTSSINNNELIPFEKFLLFYLPIKYLLNRFIPATGRLRFLK
jgi:hypothetical protein